MFLLTSAQVVLLVGWTSTGELMFLGWGSHLAEVAWSHPQVYTALLLGHLAGVGITLLAGLLLFRVTTVRLKLRKALTRAATLLALADGLVWLTVPFYSAARALAGPLAALVLLLTVALSLVPLKQMWLFHRIRGKRDRTRVVIVGGGFAGLAVARMLDGLVGHWLDLDVLVLDRNNYFLFPPLLPSVAAGSIETRQVTYPFRRIFETTNIRFQKAEVERIDPATKTVWIRREADVQRGAAPLEDSSCPYDYLVVAPGSDTNTFKTPGVEAHAFRMRELGDAVAVRNHVIDCFEHAACASSEGHQSDLLRFVIVGGGPTGVELATEIHDLVQHVLLKRYPEIHPSRVEVVLVQSGPRLLPGWHDRLVEGVERHLGGMQLKIRVGQRVSEVGPTFVKLASGEVLETRTCVWCAGVKPAGLLARCGLPLDASGRVAVTPELRPEGFPEVFVLGDAAHLVDPRTRRPLPPLGQVAFQQGPLTARNIVRLLEGRPPRPFRYLDFGQLVSVGEQSAAVRLLGVRLQGFLAWIVWRSLYLGKLVGFSNKLRVTLDWTLDLLVERSISQIASRPPRLQTETP